VARLIMVVLWPSFLVAIVAEGFFFSLLDPHELTLAGSRVDVSPLALYSVGFFFFWLFCALASLLTCYLISVPNDRAAPF
jgi:hypothetical protein